MEASQDPTAGSPEEEQRDEHNPAAEQAPVATDRQEAIKGDPGFGEQQPTSAYADQDTPVRTSPPPPAAQSGIPLPEDREAAARNEAPLHQESEADPESSAAGSRSVPDGVEGDAEEE